MTLVGTPGAGKTRLALMAAEALADFFPDGVWFVDLTAARDAGHVLEAIAAALDMTDATGGELAETLERVLLSRHALLVLDNFEQVLPAATTVNDLLRGCPRLKVLVTSRAPLHLSLEQQFLVPPFEVPNLSGSLRVQDLEQNPAVSLFKLRAQAVNPTWELTADEGPAVAEICVRLDGLPLAIELAASWVGLMPSRAILRRLTPTLDLLVARNRDQAVRHQTLRAAIEWSEDLLHPEHASLFRRLAVFSGGWTLEAAASVCQQDDYQEGALLDALAPLVDHHLIFPVVQTDGEPRFSMLATIREYGLERLAEIGELELVRHRHAAYFLELVEEFARAYHSPRQSIWLDLLEREYDNVRAVLDWCLSGDDPEMAQLGLGVASSLWFFWTVRGHIKEGRDLLANLQQMGGAQGRTAARAHAMLAAGWLAWFSSDAEGALPVLEESVQLHRELGDDQGTARSMAVLGLTLGVYTEELANAQRTLDEAMRLGRVAGEPVAIGFAAYGLGHLAARLGDDERAREHFEHTREISQEVGNVFGVAYTLYRLSLLALRRGDLVAASLLQSQSLSLCWELRNKRGLAVSTEALACLAGIQRRGQRAAQLFGFASALMDSANYVLTPPLAELRAQAETAARTELGDRVFAAAWEEGRKLPLEAGIVLALGEGGTPGKKAAGALTMRDAALSQREVQIVQLVAKGLTDRQIASRLSISPRTVDGHLRRIFAKVGVSSRTALAAWAIRQGIA